MTRGFASAVGAASSVWVEANDGSGLSAAGFKLTKSFLDINHCIDGFRGPHSCTMIWMNLVDWVLIASFLKVAISRTLKLTGRFPVPDVLPCSPVEVLQVSWSLLG